MTVLRFTSLLSICFIIYFFRSEYSKISAVTDFPVNPQMPTVAALLHDLPY